VSAFANPPEWLPVLLRTAVIGLVFGVIASVLGIPLPWMLGPLFGTAAFALAGTNLDMPRPLKLASRVFIGLILGAAIDADTFARVGQWPASLALMLAGMATITALTTFYYLHVARLDRLTSVAASLPGGLSSITAIAIQMGANGPATVMGQLFRLTSVVVLVPTGYALWLGSPEGMAPGVGASTWMGANLWVILLAPPAVWLARLVRMPSGEMIGPMILAGALGMAGFKLVLPVWLFAAVFIVLGSSIGARFRSVTSRLLMGLGRHSLVATAISLASVALLAWPLSHVADVPLHVALLAVAPGGIAEMAALAAVLGVDPVFVTFHQAFRSVILHAAAPFVLARFRNRNDDA